MKSKEGWTLIPRDSIQIKPTFTGTSIVLMTTQIYIGISFGFVSDYLLNRLCFDLLIKFKLIVLVDAFDAIYSNRGLQDTFSWMIFVSLLLSFLYLSKLPRFSYFGATAMVTHLLVGGFFTLANVFIRW